MVPGTPSALKTSLEMKLVLLIESSKAYAVIFVLDSGWPMTTGKIEVEEKCGRFEKLDKATEKSCSLLW